MRLLPLGIAVSVHVLRAYPGLGLAYGSQTRLFEKAVIRPLWRHLSEQWTLVEHGLTDKLEGDPTVPVVQVNRRGSRLLSPDQFRCLCLLACKYIPQALAVGQNRLLRTQKTATNAHVLLITDDHLLDAGTCATRSRRCRVPKVLI